MGPPGFEPGTNRFLNASCAYEPGALTWLSYGPSFACFLLYCCFQVDLSVFLGLNYLRLEESIDTVECKVLFIAK